MQLHAVTKDAVSRARATAGVAQAHQYGMVEVRVPVMGDCPLLT